MTEAELQQAIASDIGRFAYDPAAFARYNWAHCWNTPELAGSPGPRKWQGELFDYIGRHLRNPATRFTPCRVAVSSGHGIGKSAAVSMLMDWALSTFAYSKLTLTANTDTQLSTKTWPEVEKWFRLGINAHWWQVNAKSITARGRQFERLWRADRVAWSKHSAQAFAGLHNLGKRIVLIFDEASEIDSKIWEVSEGALTDEGTEIIWVVFGNPTQNTGTFRECFSRFKHRWQPYQIDARTVEGTNQALFKQWVEDYGEDSDFVRVRVRGEFPRSGINQFIPDDLIEGCRKYKAVGFDNLPKILAIDVARFGDDQTVFMERQGRRARLVRKYRGLDTVQTAERAIEVLNESIYDATVVDGDGIGAGVIDQLRHRGYRDRLFEFHGGAEPRKPKEYYNRRAEVWGLMRDALKAGMEIPDLAELASDLRGPQYGFDRESRIQLEKKEDMKRRGLASPDLADALAMTFSVNVLKRDKPASTPAGGVPPGRPGSWMQ